MIVEANGANNLTRASGRWGVQPVGRGGRATVVVVALALLALLASACGTRLSDEAFRNTSSDGATQGGVGPGDAGGADQLGESSDGGSATEGVTDTGGTAEGGTAGGETGGTAEGGTGGTGTGGGATAGEGGGDTGGGTAGGGTNGASDVGVTASQITIGNITAVGGPIGPEAFSGMLHGAQTYFQFLNERGGVNGRKVKFVTCDDREDPDRNQRCAQNLVETQKVFALVANSTVAYSSAKYVDSKGVPDVGGQPIGNAYYKYPHLFSVLGVDTPRSGKAIGDNGKLYAQSASYRHFREKVGVTKAAVFFYFIPISRTAGMFIADGLRKEGIEVVYYGGGSEAGMNPAAPSYDTDVIQMRREGVQGIWNAIDIAGFQKLCQSMDRYSFRVKANVSTIQGMSQKVGQDFSAPCRNDVYVQTDSISYANTANPKVAEFRAAMKKFDPGFRMHQWGLEGWAAAKMLTEGISRQGANVTRKGLMDWLNAMEPDSYSIDGLMNPIGFKPRDHSKPSNDCFKLHQWQDSAQTFVTRADVCIPAPYYSYTPQDDGS